MKIFMIDSDTLTSEQIKHHFGQLKDRRVIWAENIQGVFKVYMRYQSTQADGTQLTLIYIDDDHDAMIINHQGDTLIQGHLIFNYEASFGNPMPYIIRQVQGDLPATSPDSNISIRTDYLALEAIAASHESGGIHTPLPINLSDKIDQAASDETNMMPKLDIKEAIDSSALIQCRLF